MRPSGTVLVLSALFLIAGAAVAHAGGLCVPGVGATASGMGGAFVGLADDYSAVAWNPAGILQIQGTEATVSAQDVTSIASRDGMVLFNGLEGDGDGGRFATQPVRATSAMDQLVAPGVFLYTSPGFLGGLFDKVGICAYTLADYGVKWDGSDVADEIVLGPRSFTNTFREGAPPDYESRIRAYSISPVVAKKLTSSLSIGISGHALYSHFLLTDGGWADSVKFVDNPSPQPDEWNLYLYPYQMEEDVVGWTYGATVGLLYQASPGVSIGATARTPMKVTLEGDVNVRSTAHEYESPKQTENFDFTFPAWAGLGLAYRNFLFDGMTLTGDVQWTQWSAVDEIVRNVGTELPNGLGTTKLNWEDTIDLGVGLNYRLSRSISLVGGYGRVASPSPDETYNFLLPLANRNNVSMGVRVRRDVWRFDVSLAYGIGDARQISGSATMDGKHLEDLLVPSLALTYGF